MFATSIRAAVLALTLTAGLICQWQPCYYIPSDTPTTGTCNTVPFGDVAGHPNFANQKYQTVVPLASLRLGTITGLAFASCGSSTRSMASIKITMAQLPGGVLGTNFAGNLVNNVRRVLDRSPFLYECVADAWSEIELDVGYSIQPHEGDLVIDIEIAGSDSNLPSGPTTSGFRRDSQTRLYANTFTGTPPATGGLDDRALKMKLCYGSHIGVPDLDSSSSNNGVNFPFGYGGSPAVNSVRYQTMATAAELRGYQPAIREISFASHPASLGTTQHYQSIEIRMAHSPAPVLGTDFMSNLVSPPGGALVFSRSNVTIEWAADKWNSFPLDTEFPYDGISNLVVEVITSGITGSTAYCRTEVRPGLYAANANPTPVLAPDQGLKMRFGTADSGTPEDPCAYIPSDSPSLGSCSTTPFGTQLPDPTFENQKYQTIVPIESLREQTITGLAFASCRQQTRSMSSIKIRMGQLPSGVLGANFNGNLVNNVQTVLDRTGFQYACTANTWSDIELDVGYRIRPGEGDLVIDVEVMGNDLAAGSSAGFHGHTQPSVSRFGWFGSAPATGNLSTSALKMRLCFGTHLGVPDLGADLGNVRGSIPWGQGTNPKRHQTLVKASELGGVGSFLTGIAYALHPASSLSQRTYQFIEIRVAHTAANTLSPTFDTNLGSPSGGRLVYSRSNITIDWVEDTWKHIAFDVPFPYDGHSNLVVETRVLGVGGQNGTDSRYYEAAGQNLQANGLQAITGTISQYTPKMRLTMQPGRSASSGSRGTGCGPIGNGLALSTTTRPVHDESLGLLMVNGPTSGPGFLLIGFDAPNPPYPLDLGIIGMPQCVLYGNIALNLPAVFNNGTSSVPLPIPADPIFSRALLYLQGAAIWPGANPGGIVVSNQIIVWPGL